MKRLVLVGMVAAVLVLAAPKAEAAAVLTLSSGGATITITDDGALDFWSGAGTVAWLGTIGNWTFNSASGVAGLNPLVHLNSVNSLTGSGVGLNALTVTFSSSDFSGPIPAFTSGIGGYLQAGGTLTYQAWLDAGNVLGLTTTPIGLEQMFGPGAFSGTVYGGSAPAGLYSLTQRVVLSSTAYGTTSFDAIVDVPEPGSMVLFGTGLLVLAAVARRRMRKA